LGWTENAWATALAVTFFVKKLANEKESWELVCNKAKKWLVKECPSTADKILAHAEQFL